MNTTRFILDGANKVTTVVSEGDALSKSRPECEVVKEALAYHHCPRCGSYFFGRWGGFPESPFFGMRAHCANCYYTYPRLSIEELRAAHLENGTLEEFDNGGYEVSGGTIALSISEGKNAFE